MHYCLKKASLHYDYREVWLIVESNRKGTFGSTAVCITCMHLTTRLDVECSLVLWEARVLFPDRVIAKTLKLGVAAPYLGFSVKGRARYHVKCVGHNIFN